MKHKFFCDERLLYLADVTTWLTSKNIKHMEDLKLGLSEGIEWASHKINYSNARLDIYMPKNVYTPVKATQWKNHLKGLYPEPNCQNPTHVLNNIDEVELHIVVEKLSDINNNDWINAIKSKLPVGEKDNLIITISEL